VANIIVAIVTLVITFILASYGVYQNIESSRRSQNATVIGSTISRLAQYNQELREELGHQPLSVSEESGTGYGYYDQAVLDRAAYGTVTYRFNANGTGYYVCASSGDVSTTMQESMQMVARDRPGAFVSGECGVTGTAVSNLSVVSMKIGS
jgi:hypothetical protein